MHTSVSAKLTRKPILALIFMAALCIPSYGEKSPPPPAGASRQCTTPCQSSSPNQNTCCLSPDAQIEAARNEAARDAAAAQNAALQTKAGIDAAKDAAKHAGDMEEEAVKMFCWVSGFTSILLVLMLAVVGIGLAKGQWSLREALSEKPLVHPREGAAILLPSTSRFIALFGLLGIVTILLGVGYAITWNLLIYHKPPDNLSEIDSFLLGAASLFAPYIANQLRAAFQTPPGEKPTGEAGATNAPVKTAETNAAKPNAEIRQT